MSYSIPLLPSLVKITRERHWAKSLSNDILTYLEKKEKILQNCLLHFKIRRSGPSRRSLGLVFPFFFFITIDRSVEIVIQAHCEESA